VLVENPGLNGTKSRSLCYLYQCVLFDGDQGTRKTLTKTRKFVVNGVVMTSQTSKLVADDVKKQQEREHWSVTLQTSNICDN